MVSGSFLEGCGCGWCGPRHFFSYGVLKASQFYQSLQLCEANNMR